MSKAVEEMTREELQATVRDLRDRVQHIESYHLPLLTKVLKELTDAPDDADLAGLVAPAQDCREEIEQAATAAESFAAVGSAESTKEEKIAQVLQFADNQRREEQSKVTVKPDTIAGITGVSERWAHKLVDHMIGGDGDQGTVGPDGYDWALDPRTVERPIDQDTPDKGVLVDFDRLHRDPGSLIRINNGSDDQGGQP